VVGQRVRYPVMGDLYGFEVVMSDGTGRYMLRWDSGKGTFWVSKGDLDRANPSVGNSSGKRVGRRRAAVLASLVTSVLMGLYLLLFWMSCTVALMGWVTLGFMMVMIAVAAVMLWHFFFGIFIDKFFC